MPALLTHYCFAKYLAKSDSHIAITGSQGPDPFFAHGNNIFKKRENSKAVVSFGSALHLIDPSEAYYHLILKAKDSPDKDILLPYVDGLLMHYSLDTLAHPYVFYRSGYSEDPEKHKMYSLAHNYFEAMLDTEVRDLYGDKMKPNKCMPLSDHEASVITRFWDEANRELHIIDGGLPENAFIDALKDYRFIMRFLLSRNGIKRSIIRTIFGVRSRIYCYSYYARKKETRKYDLLNVSHAEWKNPSTGEIHDESFVELAELALKKYERLRKIKEGIIKGEMTLEDFRKEVGGRNHDGSPIDNLEKKYFGLAFDWGKDD